MRKLISAICAVLISVGTFGSVETANTAPLTVQKPIEAATNNPNVENVRHRDRWDRRWDRRHYRRHNRWDRRHYGWERRYHNRRWDRRYDRRYYRRYDRPRYYRSWDDGPSYNRYYRRSGVSVILDF